MDALLGGGLDVSTTAGGSVTLAAIIVVSDVTPTRARAYFYATRQVAAASAVSTVAAHVGATSAAVVWPDAGW